MTGSVPTPSENQTSAATQRTDRNQLLALAEAAAAMSAPETLDDTLREVAAQARRVLPGAGAAGMLLRRARGVLEAVDGADLAGVADRLHVALDEGPAVTAVGDDVPVSVADMAGDGRWPRYAPRAGALGVRSMLALPLRSPRAPVGVLTVYATEPAAFDAAAELTAQAFAAHAAIAITQADLETNLRMGLQTREEIGRAVGIVMDRHRVSAARAFDMLVFASQRAHLKLRDVAGWVNETGEDPSNLIPMRRPAPTARSAPRRSTRNGNGNTGTHGGPPAEG